MIRFLARRVHYGWVIVAACFGVTLIMGETFWSFGVFLKPLSNEFGWTRAEFSTAYSVFMATYAISSVLTGRFADRYGPRYVLLASAVLVSSGLALSSLITDINQMRAFFGVIGLGAGGTWAVPTSTVMRWFTRAHGLALGIVTAGVGVGALIFAPFINYLIERSGWRQAFLITGMVSLGIVLLCVLFLVDSPEKIGLKPYGEASRSAPPARAKLGTREAVRMGAFWGVILAGCIGAFGFNALSVHFVALATDMGISPAPAAGAQGLIGGFSLVGRVGGGVFAERKGWRLLLGLAFAGTVASVLLLFFLKSLFLVYVFALVFGAAHGARMISSTGILGHYFGMHSVGELIGILNGVSTILGALGPILAGVVFDRTGSYFPALAVFVIFYLVALVAILRLRRPISTSPSP